MLTDHRRAFWYSIALLGACVLSLVVVGRHPPSAAPETTVPFVGHFDATVYRWMAEIQTAPLTWFCKFLSVIGGGLVTVPVRVVASIVLLIRRWWHRLAAFVLTWVASEVLLTVLKAWFHRGRPPYPLVVVKGFSFPSGHAVAAAATGVALVLAFFSPGSNRRKWEWIAVGFTFVMALSRVYLHAHWFSDVVAGVLLGSGIAIGSAALAIEVRGAFTRRRALRPDPAAAARRQ